MVRKLANKSRYLFQRKKIQLLSKAGLGDALMHNREGKRILIYHGIDQKGRKDLNSRFISKALLEKQLAYFAENFNCLSVAEYFEKGIIKNGKLSIALTFDDGYLNNYTHVLPLLEKYNIPASFYVTGLHDTTEGILWADLVDISNLFLKGELTILGSTFKKI